MKNFVKCIVTFIKGTLFGIAIYGLADPFIRDWCKRKLDIRTDWSYSRYPHHDYSTHTYQPRMRVSYADDDEE